MTKKSAEHEIELVARTQPRPAERGAGDGLNRLLDLQRTAGNEAVTELVEQQRSPVLDVLSSGGRPLDDDVRADMELRLGADFADVRIHTGTDAHDSAVSVNAHAYTVGSDIVFQRDAYNPHSTVGRTTLAHELTHVIQQRSGPVDGTPTDGGIRVSDPDDRYEREAAATADRVVEMAQPGAAAADHMPPEPALARTGSRATVQRQDDDELKKAETIKERAQDAYEHVKHLFSRDNPKPEDYEDWSKNSEEVATHAGDMISAARVGYQHLAGQAMRAGNADALEKANHALERVERAHELLEKGEMVFKVSVKTIKIVQQCDEMVEAAKTLSESDLGDVSSQKRAAAAIDQLAGGFGKLGGEVLPSSSGEVYFDFLSQFSATKFFEHWAEFIQNYTGRALRAAEHD